jgi:hypothetical protein
MSVVAGCRQGSSCKAATDCHAHTQLLGQPTANQRPAQPTAISEQRGWRVAVSRIVVRDGGWWCGQVRVAAARSFQTIIKLYEPLSNTTMNDE